MKTQKRRVNKPYTVFQTGNILICTRIPIGRIYKGNKTRIRGGAENDNDYLQTEIFQNLVSALGTSSKAEDKELQKYLEEENTMAADKSSLLKFIFKKKNEPEYEDLFKAVQTRKLNMRKVFDDGTPEHKLYTLLSTKVQARNMIEKIKAEVEEIPTMDEDEKKSIISSLENGSGMTVSTISSKAMNSLRSGTESLANIFAPTLPAGKTDKKKRNETNVEILFFDKDHLHYKKGDSPPAIPDDERQFADFMVINRPTKYTNTHEYLKEMTESVEDLLAQIAKAGENVLCSGNSEKCKKYSVKRKPYMHRVMRIVDKQPQVDNDKKKQNA
jgi:hypothetical protein